jgi:hypothetical protein
MIFDPENGRHHMNLGIFAQNWKQFADKIMHSEIRGEGEMNSRI